MPEARLNAAGRDAGSPGDRESISVAMATYNGAAFIEAQLDSLERQDLKPAELVVCDDRSTDDTVDIVRRFAAGASFPVRIFVNPERLGWRGNFVKASGLCASSLIAFCDQDDLWYPDKLATVVGRFEDPQTLLVFHNADLVDGEGRPYGTLLPITDAARRIPPRSRPTIWSNPLGLTMSFRSVLTRYNDLWPESADLAVPGKPAAHDQWFYFLATNLGTVVDEPRRLLAYRQHQGNSVGWSETQMPSGIPGARAVAADIARVVGMLRPFCAALKKAAACGDAFESAFDEAYRKNHRLLQRYERRAAFYGTAGRVERLRHLITMIRRTDYAQRTDWGFGNRALLHDLTVGLFGREG